MIRSFFDRIKNLQRMDVRHPLKWFLSGCVPFRYYYHYAPACTWGLTRHRRAVPVTVSVTSFPDRMNTISTTLNTLLTQTLKPDRLVLWLADTQFPNREDDLPSAVLQLKKWGLEIRWCQDTRSYKKLLPSLKEFPEDILVTADDDVYYHPRWLEYLYASYRKHPNCLHAHRCHGIRIDMNGNILPYKDWDFVAGQQSPSYLNFLTGVGGVLYPPHSLHPEIFRQDVFSELVPSNDDIWFWGMAVKQGTKTAVPSTFFHEIRHLVEEQDISLWQTNEVQNDVQIGNLLHYYPEILERIRKEISQKAP